MSTTTYTKTANFRPERFEHIVGQSEIVESLKMKAMAFFKTGRAVGHILFIGPSGLGKTTLANVLANELCVGFHKAMATRLVSRDDLLSLFINVKESDVVFIDELHALNPMLQETLYGIMEDFRYEVVENGRVKEVKLPRFTLVGATTHAGDLNEPLRMRFPYIGRLEPYNVDELARMAEEACQRVYGITIPQSISRKIARLSRRTARNAYSLLHNLMEVAEARVRGVVTSNDLTLDMLNTVLRTQSLDPVLGLDYASRRYLVALSREHRGLGVRSIASLINEQPSTVQSMVEPFLLGDLHVTLKDRVGTEIVLDGPLVRMTKTGRTITDSGRTLLKLLRCLQDEGWFANERLA